MAAMKRFYNVVYPDDLPAAFDGSQRCRHEADLEHNPDGLGTWSCYRPVWNGYDSCIWHAEEAGKPVDQLRIANDHERSWPQMYSDVSLTTRLDQAYLRSLTVEEERTEEFDIALSFTGCTMLESNFAYSQISNMSFKNVSLHGSNFKEVDISRTIMQGCNLNDTNFQHAQLQGIRLLREDIENSNWIGAKLDGANLHDSNFSGTNLQYAKLPDARVTKTNLKGCNLEEAELEQTDLRGADLTNARLSEALVRDARINEGTTFGEKCSYEREADREAMGNKDSSMILDPIRAFGNRLRRRSDDTEVLSDTVRVYRLYQRLLRESSLPSQIREYRIREKHSRRKLALREGRYGQWLKLSLDRWIMCYGESPGRVVSVSVFIILVFAVLYAIVGQIDPSPPGAVQTLYVSSTIFTNLGFGNFQPAGSMARALTGLESFIGALLMALLVFTLGRRATW